MRENHPSFIHIWLQKFQIKFLKLNFAKMLTPGGQVPGDVNEKKNV